MKRQLLEIRNGLKAAGDTQTAALVLSNKWAEPYCNGKFSSLKAAKMRVTTVTQPGGCGLHHNKNFFWVLGFLFLSVMFNQHWLMEILKEKALMEGRNQCLYIIGSKWDHKCPKQYEKGCCQEMVYDWAGARSLVTHISWPIPGYFQKISQIWVVQTAQTRIR